MTREPTRIHPSALQEAEAAIEWYRERSPRAARRFLEELTATIEQIEQDPHRFPLFHFGMQLFSGKHQSKLKLLQLPTGAEDPVTGKPVFYKRQQSANSTRRFSQ